MRTTPLTRTVAFSAFAALGVSQAGQNLAQYDVLKEPRITKMPAQKMLVVEVKGDPNMAGTQAFGLLYKVFFAIEGARPSAPRARWPQIMTAPKSEWTGFYALPVPENASLPDGSSGAKIVEWQYGDVAEILHYGSYADEGPTIQRLMRFIAEQGYVIAGPHEEEYLRGPESGPNTGEYRTIIRYQVRKK
jgi:hypothetical protein